MKKRIGLQLTELEGSYNRMLWPEVVSAARDLDVHLILFPGQNPGSILDLDQQFTTIYNMISEESLDAVILETAILQSNIGPSSANQLISAISSKLPVLSIGISYPEIPSIVIDNKTGIHQAVSHLVHEHQHKKIGFLKGPRTSDEAQQRYLAYLDAIGKHSLTIPDGCVFDGDFRAASARDVARAHLEKIRELDGIICCNDGMALGLYQELMILGVRIPEDLTLIGFDDIEAARYIPSPMTTVRQPFRHLAKRSVEMAVDMAHGKEVPMESILPTELIVRQSCGCRPHITKPIYLEQYAEVLSQRTLVDDFFRNTMLSNFPEIEIHRISNRIYQFIKKFLSVEPDKEIITELLDELDSLVSEESAHFGLSLDWQEVISFLYTVSKRLSPSHVLFSHYDFFQKARILIGERNEIQQGLIRMNYFTELTVPLRDLLFEVLSCKNEEHLIQIVQRNLERLCIGRLSILVYHQETKKDFLFSRMAEYGRILYLRILEKDFQFSEEWNQFPVTQLVPAEFWEASIPMVFVVSPLFFSGDSFGYCVSELSSIDCRANEELRICISAALDRLQLLTR